jgi:hypothetical protein
VVRNVVLVLPVALLVLADCRGRRDEWYLRYPMPLGRQVGGVEGRPCSDGAEHDACDPFICDGGTCRVETCTSKRECSRGSCIEGYCALPPPQPGRKCESFDEDAARGVLSPAKVEPPGMHDETVAKHFARYDGCTCRPSYWTTDVMYAHSVECGPFPCTPNGCYVQKCGADSDCAAGFCSSHASWPNGWCVTSDPH